MYSEGEERLAKCQGGPVELICRNLELCRSIAMNEVEPQMNDCRNLSLREPQCVCLQRNERS